MSDIIELLSSYFSFPFVRYAFVVGILIALCSSLLGVTLVLKRLSFIGDGLSHVAFGAMAIATVLKISNLNYLVLPVTALVSILLIAGGSRAKIKGDAALAMLSVGALAFGYLLMNMFSTSSNLAGDVCSTLFGSTSILTLRETDVLTCSVISAVVILFFVLFYHKIFNITFDEEFSRAAGIHVRTYNFVLALIIAMVIVVAMNLVGSLLISALIVFPPLSAMRLFSSFKSVTISAVAFSVVGAAGGMLISILAATPVGATIVAMDVFLFALSCIVGCFRKA